MPNRQRIARIDHEVQRILGSIISQELTDPRLGFVTVTRVDVTDDLRSCKVFVSVIGDREEAQRSLQALHHAAGFLRGELGHRIALRYTPELSFVEDRSAERAIELAKDLRADAQRRASTTEEVVAVLRERTAFVMVSHVKPDGDTLGAGLALGIALERLGKRVYYFQQDAVPRNLRFLPAANAVSRSLPEDLPSDALFVFCDMSDPARAGAFLPKVVRENVLDIDHHLGNGHFGAYNYVLPAECSTGTCVMHLLRALDVEIDADIATCVLTTIMTDTGGLMHSNTSPEALELAAELMRAGADKERITREIFGNKRVAATKLLGQVVGAMEFGHDGRYCWSHVDDSMLASCGADGEDTEDVVNVLLGQEGVEVAALFKAYDGELRVSLRSTGRVNVQAAAARLGGGGHFRASGLEYTGTLPQAVTAVDGALVSQGL